MAGWIKIFRKLQDWQWYSDGNMVRIFLHLLLEANHEKRYWKGIEILPGQLIYGRKAWSETLGISEQSLRTCITRLKSTNEITIKSTNKFSLVTIVNWENYQGDEKKSTSKSTNKLTNEQPTTNQQLTTPKEDKEDKKSLITRFQRFIDLVNSTFKKQYRYSSKKAFSSFKQRIEVEKYDPREIKKVIQSLKDTTFHIQSNYKYCTPEFILRQDKIEKYKHGAITDRVIKMEPMPVQGQKYNEETNLYSEFQ